MVKMQDSGFRVWVEVAVIVVVVVVVVIQGLGLGSSGCFLHPQLCASVWEFPKIRGTVFWGFYNEDPTI